jgi:hypothetical protein
MPLPALFDDLDQPAFRKDTHVFGDRGLTDPKVLSYGIQRQRLPRQQTDDRPPRRIGNGLENISPCFHKYITEWLCKTI